jgi:hypothetical protein
MKSHHQGTKDTKVYSVKPDGRRALTPNGHHHEIFLTDPKRVAPEKMKTVLREPVRSSG